MLQVRLLLIQHPCKLQQSRHGAGIVVRPRIVVAGDVVMAADHHPRRVGGAVGTDDIVEVVAADLKGLADRLAPGLAEFRFDILCRFVQSGNMMVGSRWLAGGEMPDMGFEPRWIRAGSSGDIAGGRQDRISEKPGEADGGDGPTGSPTPDQWHALRDCESNNNYRAVSPTGRYRGAYQFSISTWDWLASSRYPELVGVDPIDASPADQDRMAYALYALNGASPWPHCGRYLS